MAISPVLEGERVGGGLRWFVGVGGGGGEKPIQDTGDGVGVGAGVVSFLAI